MRCPPLPPRCRSNTRSAALERKHKGKDDPASGGGGFIPGGGGDWPIPGGSGDWPIPGGGGSGGGMGGCGDLKSRHKCLRGPKRDGTCAWWVEALSPQGAWSGRRSSCTNNAPAACSLTLTRPACSQPLALTTDWTLERPLSPACTLLPPACPHPCCPHPPGVSPA